MKLRTTCYVLIVLLILATLYPITSSAQDASVYMYWTEMGTSKIRRANLDGTHVQDLLTGFGRTLGIALDVAGGKMYWADRDPFDHADPAGRSSIRRANLDGTNSETLVLGGNSVKEYIALDLSGGKVYWTQWSVETEHKIRRANLNGTNVEDLVTVRNPRGIALDISQGKMYWTDDSKIYRTNLDGSNVQDVATGDTVHAHGIALDAAGRKIYWADWISGKIQRANLDGTNAEDLVGGLQVPFGITLDTPRGKIYWTDNAAHKIQRANLDGTNVEDLVTTGLVNPFSIALGIPQTTGGLRFTPNTIADQTFTVGTSVSLTLPSAIGGTAPYIYSISVLPAGLYFDASRRQIYGTPTTVVSAHPVTYTVRDTAGLTASLNFTITVQTTPRTNVYMYWTDDRTKKIQRANLDGTNVQDLVTTGLELPESIALDRTSGKMYWTDTGTNRIQRANLNGTNVENLIVGVDRPEGIALDLTAGKIYWSENGTDTIRRADFNGSNAETLVTGVADPEGIALDLTAGKIYWSDWGIGEIGRANLDGTNAEEVVTTLHNPDGVAIDSVGGKLYWTDAGAGKIQRANLDGSNIEDLVTIGLGRPDGIALDVGRGKLYWTDINTSKIQRANLDGSNIEDLVTTGLGSPKRIALGIPQAPAGLRFDPNIIADQTFTVGTDVSLTLPMATGGSPPYTYSTSALPPGLHFDPVDRWLNGTPTTVVNAHPVTYTATDAIGVSASLTFTITVEVNLDVNGDGRVDVLDLVWVAVSYGMRGNGLPADVNADGVINVQDLVAVAGGIDAAAALPAKVAEEVLLAAEAAAAEFEGVAGAPAMRFNTPPQMASGITAYSNVAAALVDAKHLATGDVRLGKWIPLLKELLHRLAEFGTIPETTALLPNYPNPFNPETWIPYHLAQGAEVTLTIYNMQGVIVRQLMLGHQSAGVYKSRGRAAYWDGRNNSGEKVASGVYFYTLTAGDFTATRKLLIAK